MNKTVYDRAAIMRHAHEIARLQRRADAQRAYDRDISRLGNRVVHNRTLEAHLAETRLDLASAMKEAWRQAKTAQAKDAAPEGWRNAPAAPGGALTILRTGAPALRRRLRIGLALRMAARALRAVPGVLRFLSNRFIPERREAA